MVPQGATDEQIDAAVQAVQASPTQENYYRLQDIARTNWPRVIWNYRRSDGCGRARILFGVHYNGNYSYQSPLVPLACKDPGWQNRQIGAIYVERSISNGKLPASTEKLQSQLFRDRAWQVRIVVAKGLQWQGPPAKSMLMKLTQDPSRFVRIQAGMSLARQKDERAIPVLVELLDKQDGFPVVMDAGGEWRPENFLADFREKMLPFVVPKLKSRSWKMRMHAIDTLICANPPKLFEYGKTLVNDKVPLVRYEGLRAIALTRNPEAIPILIKAARDQTEIIPRSTIALNVRLWLQSGAEVDNKPWPEGVAALKAAGIKD